MARPFVIALLIVNISAVAVAANTCPSAGPSKSVLTQGNNNCRTDANLDESVLHTSNVDAGHFGKLGSYSVDGYIFAQPLYYPGLMVNGVVHDVVFVATLNNSVYAFDADSPGSAALWRTSVGTPYGQAAQPGQSCPPGSGPPPLGAAVLGCLVGIVSTPVIDPSTNFLYCVKIDSAANWWLIGIDITSGSVIKLAQIGTNQPQFVPVNHLQRPGLLLSGGVLYIAFGSWNDDQSRASYGWLFAYDASSFAYQGSMITVPISSTCTMGSVWQSGRGPAGDDAGNVYFQTGNLEKNNSGQCSSGTGYNSSSILAEGIIKAGAAAQFIGAFQPNYTTGCLNPHPYCDNPSVEDFNDFDLGVSGPMLLPRTNLMVNGGKLGIVYLLDTGTMSSPKQRFLATGYDTSNKDFPLEVASLAYWDRQSASPLMYIWGLQDRLKAFTFDPGTGVFQTTPTLGPPEGAHFPGGMLSVTANAGTAGTGIVWATFSTIPCDGQGGTCGGYITFSPQPGTLAAYDASNVSRRLYSTAQNPGRDSLGNFAKFTPPTVANGRLFVPSLYPNELLVYGPFRPDVLAVMKSGTAMNTTEVHQLTVSSAYQQFGLQTGTALATTDSTWSFTTADLDIDGRPDLVGVHKSGTASGKTEVHVLGAFCSGISGYFQGFLLDTPTALGQTDSSWEYQMADVDGDGLADLVAIHKWNTASGKTEVTVLKGTAVGTCAAPSSSSFQTVIWQGPVGLGATSSSWTFRMADMDLDGKPDLVGIQENGGTSGKTELYVLSGASNFQTLTQHIATGLGYTSSASWDFWLADYGLDGKPDLYAIWENGTPSGKTEIKVLGSAGNYQTFALQTVTALGPTDSNFVFLGVPWQP